MEFDADITIDAGGSAVADGGYCIALRDFAGVGQLFLNGGRAEERQVVPTSWIEECRRPNPMPFDRTSFGAELPGASYHNQWWLFDDRSFALGIHGHMFAVDFNPQLVVVLSCLAP